MTFIYSQTFKACLLQLLRKTQTPESNIPQMPAMLGC